MKTMTYPKAKAGLFAAAMMTANMLGTGTAEAYACKSEHPYLVGTGVHATQAGAVTMAKNQWKTKVKAEFGLPWAVWEISEGQHVQCAANGGGKSCVVRSRSCKHVVK